MVQVNVKSMLHTRLFSHSTRGGTPGREREFNLRVDGIETAGASLELWPSPPGNTHSPKSGDVNARRNLGDRGTAPALS